MKTFRFKTPATEIQYGTAYFEVQAETEEEARAKLVDDSSEHFVDFTETDGNTDWDASKPEDFETY